MASILYKSATDLAHIASPNISKSINVHLSQSCSLYTRYESSGTHVFDFLTIESFDSILYSLHSMKKIDIFSLVLPREKSLKLQGSLCVTLTQCHPRSNLVLLFYLSVDAAHLGLLSSVWAMSFLTERLPRMILMIFLFPLISFGLCAWMAVFGFYLRLEEKAWMRYLNKVFSRNF